MTLQVLFCSALLSFTFGSLMGILLCNRLRTPFLSLFLEIGMFTFRAIPFFVWLLLVYFVFPDLFGFSIDSFTAAVLALGLCSSGYIAQIVRAGINSIPVSQWEMAYCLGYSLKQALLLIILPQMKRNVLPAFTNELDSLVKSTAAISSIGLLELTRVGMNIVSRELKPVPIYLAIAFFYLLISAIMNYIMKKIERRYSYVTSR